MLGRRCFRWGETVMRVGGGDPNRPLPRGEKGTARHDSGENMASDCSDGMWAAVRSSSSGVDSRGAAKTLASVPEFRA